MIKWHHSSGGLPPFGEVAIIAARIPADLVDGVSYDYLLMNGLYASNGARFVPESKAVSPCRVPEHDYWYCLERDLMDHLRARIVLRANGHGVSAE